MGKITAIFYNGSERRLRAGWRLAIQVGVHFVGQGLLTGAGLFALAFALVAAGQIPFGLLNDGPGLNQALEAAFDRAPLLNAALRVLVLLGLLGLYWLLARFLDRRPFRAYGFRLSAAWWRDLGFGLLLGAVLMGLIFGFERLMGWVTVTGRLENSLPEIPFGIRLFRAFLLFVFVGVSEELFFRGYQLRNLAEGLNLKGIGPQRATVIALLASSVLFGLLHAGNQNATVVAVINVALAGVMLGLGLVLTDELALPIGLHISWNFFQGNVFGLPVSGSGTEVSLLAVAQGGPVAWTGGAFGPEAGLVGALAMLVGTGLIYAYVRWTRGRAAVQAGRDLTPQPPSLKGKGEKRGEGERVVRLGEEGRG